MSVDPFLLVNTVATGLIAASLILLIGQTAIMRKTVHEASTTNIQAYLHSVNQILLEDEDLRRLLNLTKEQVFAFIILNESETRFLFHKPGLTDNVTWDSDVTILRKSLKAEFVQDVLSNYSREFRADFIQFLRRESLMPQPAPVAPAR
jgi:hypothetical protein